MGVCFAILPRIAVVLLHTEMEFYLHRDNTEAGVDMVRKRERYTGKEKLAILRKHLLEGAMVSEICDEHDLQPTVFYRWQKQLFEEEYRGRPNKRLHPTWLVAVRIRNRSIPAALTSVIRRESRLRAH